MISHSNHGHVSIVYVGPIIGVNRWKNPIKKGKHVTMYETKEYKKFKEDLASRIRYATPFPGYVDVEIILFMDGRKDSDGPIKGIFDAIELSGIISNDNKIRDFTVQRFYDKKVNESLVISIDAVSEEEMETRSIQKKAFLDAVLKKGRE